MRDALEVFAVSKAVHAQPVAAANRYVNHPRDARNCPCADCERARQIEEGRRRSRNDR